MTNKLRCPFCGEELFVGDAFIDVQYANCRNPGCKQCGVVMPVEIWQALIQAKQDLKIAKSTLDWLGYEFPPAYPEKNVIAEMRQKARNAVKYIEHKDI